ncbi:nitroreductase [Hydrogenispora ethanolica]|jgi:nitroreductase|uniref:Nitroreductase n=1 Tax=Hydrogenispora ethanolica TaxID=1082276 RepID=A0A4R1RYR9_HYDET|nr:nitroreductase family protein [Hydrogenispora ethanolica]TCL71664.1 nitroreductase [Hydrogenispora ethanolica]
MGDFLELAATRRSIRKFQDREIPEQDIAYFIRAAVNAPSGCNSQCWRFIAVRDKAVIGRMKAAVVERVNRLLAAGGTELSPEYLESKRKMVSFFAKAPLVIAVFMTGAKFYDAVMIEALRVQGYDDAGIMKLYGHYDLLSVGAAIQNLLLAVHEKGYGACWMNEPVVAEAALQEILGVPSQERLISLIPVGVPAYVPRTKNLKEMAEVFVLR